MADETEPTFDLNSTPFKLEVFGQAQRAVQQDNPDMDPFIVNGEASRRLLEEVTIPSLASLPLSEGTVESIKTAVNKMSAHPDPAYRSSGLQQLYHDITKNSLDAMDQRTNVFGAIENTVRSFSSGDYIGGQRINDVSKLKDIYTQSAPTSMMESVVGRKAKDIEASFSGFSALQNAIVGNENTAKVYRDLAEAQKASARKIKTPEGFDEFGITDVFTSPLFALGKTAENFDSVMGMGASVAIGGVAIPIVASYYFSQKAGDVYPDLYKKAVAAGASHAEANDAAANTALWSGLQTAVTETAVDMIGGAIFKGAKGLAKGHKSLISVSKEEMFAPSAKAIMDFGGRLGLGVSSEVLQEVTEEVTQRTITNWQTEKILGRTKQALDIMEKHLGKENPAYIELKKSADALIEAGDISKIEYAKLANQAAGGALVLSGGGAAAGTYGRFKKDAKTLRTDRADMLNLSHKMLQELDTSVKEINANKALSTAEKKAAIGARTEFLTNLLSFNIDLQKKNKGISIEDLNKVNNNIQDVLTNQFATEGEKKAAVAEFEKVYGDNPNDLKNFILYGFVGENVDIDAEGTSQLQGILTSGIAGGNVKKRSEVASQINAVWDANRVVQTKKEEDTRVREAYKKADLATSEFKADNNRRESTIQDVVAFSNTLLSSEGKTREDVKKGLREMTKDYTQAELESLKKQKTRDVNVTEIIGELVTEKKDFTKKMTSLESAKAKFLEKMKPVEGVEDYAGKLERYNNGLTVIENFKTPTTALEAELQEVYVDQLGKDIATKNKLVNQEKKKALLVESLTNTIDDAALKSGVSEEAIYEALADLRNGRTMIQLDIGELRQASVIIRDEISKQGIYAVETAAEMEFQNELSDVGQGPLREDFTERAKGLSVAEKKQLTKELKNEKKKKSSYTPEADLDKHNVLTAQDLNEVITEYSDPTSEKTSKEINTLINDLVKVINGLRYSDQQTKENKDIGVTAEIGLLKLAKGMDLKKSDEYMKNAVRQAVNSGRRRLNDLQRKLSDKDFIRSAKSLNKETKRRNKNRPDGEKETPLLDIPSQEEMDADIEAIRELVRQIDEDATDVTANDAVYQKVQDQVDTILGKYRKLASEKDAIEIGYAAEAAAQEAKDRAERLAREREAKKRTDTEGKPKDPTRTDETDAATSTEVDVQDSSVEDGPVDSTEAVENMISESVQELQDLELLDLIIGKVEDNEFYRANGDPRLATLLRRMFLYLTPTRETKISKRMRESSIRGSFMGSLIAGINSLEGARTKDLNSDLETKAQRKARLNDLQERRDEMIVAIKEIYDQARLDSQNGGKSVTEELRNQALLKLKLFSEGSDSVTDATPYLSVLLEGVNDFDGIDAAKVSDYSLWYQVADYIPTSFFSSQYLSDLRAMKERFDSLVAGNLRGKHRDQTVKIRDMITVELNAMEERESWKDLYKSMSTADLYNLTMSYYENAIDAMRNTFESNPEAVTVNLDKFFVSMGVLSGQSGITTPGELVSTAILDKQNVHRIDSLTPEIGEDPSGEPAFSIPGTSAGSFRGDVTISPEVAREAERNGVSARDQYFVNEFNKLREQISGAKVEDISIVPRPEDVPVGTDGRVVNPGTPEARVEIFLDSLQSVDDLHRLIRHESFGHRFLAAILGRRNWRKLVRYVDNKGGIGGQSISEISNRYNSSFKESGSQRVLSRKEAVYEAIAFHVQDVDITNPTPIWKNIFTSMKIFFKNITGKDLTDAEAQFLIDQSFRKYTADATKYKEAVRQGVELRDTHFDKTGVDPLETVSLMKDQYSQRDSFIKAMEREFNPLGVSASVNEPLHLYMDRVAIMLGNDFGLEKYQTSFEDYLQDKPSPEVDKMLSAHPEMEKPLRRVKVKYAQTHLAAEKNQAEARKAQLGNMKVISKETLEDPLATFENKKRDIKDMAVVGWSLLNDQAGLIMLAAMGAGNNALALDTGGLTTTNLSDPDSDFISALRRDNAWLLNSALGLSNRTTRMVNGVREGVTGVLSPRLRRVVKIINGKKHTSLEPDVISDKSLLSRLTPYLDISDLSADSIRLDDYMVQHEIMTNHHKYSERQVKEAISKVNDHKDYYKRNNLSDPMNEVLEFYSDISYLMESAGNFTQDEIMKMRYRSTYHVSSVASSARQNAQLGTVHRSPIDSIVSEITAVTKRAGKSEFHRTFTNFMDRMAKGDDQEYRNKIQKITDGELLEKLQGSDGKILGSVNEAIKNHNANSDDIWFYRYLSKGQTHTFIVQDKALYEGIKAFEGAGASHDMEFHGWIAEKLKDYARIKRASITKYDPTFFIMNIAKDAMTNYFSGYADLSGYGKFVTDGEYRREMQKILFLTGAVDSSESRGQVDQFEDLERRGGASLSGKNKGFAKRTAGKVSDVMEGIMDFGETMGRQAVMDSFIERNMEYMMEEGISVDEREKRIAAVYNNAADKTREVLNFAQKGTNGKLNSMLQMASFSRVGLTALERGFRVPLEVWKDKSLRNRAFKRLAPLVGFTAMTMLSTVGDKAYDEIPEELKLKNFYFKVVGGYVVIPKPFGPSGVVSNMAQAAYNLMIKRDPALAQELMKGTIESMTPNVPGFREATQYVMGAMGWKDFNPSMSMIPDAFSTGYQIATNTDQFRNQKIVPEHILNKDRYFRYQDTNSPISRWLTQNLGIAAHTIEFGTGQLFGSRLMGAENFVREGVMGSEGINFLVDNPISRRLFLSDAGANRNSLTTFYDFKFEHQTKVRALNDLVKEPRYIRASAQGRQHLVDEVTGGDTNFNKKTIALGRAYRKIKAASGRVENRQDWDNLSSGAKMRLRAPIYDMAQAFEAELRMYDSP